jgi:hypothetical protein
MSVLRVALGMCLIVAVTGILRADDTQQGTKPDQKQTVVGTITKIQAKQNTIVVEPASGAQQIQTQKEVDKPGKPKQYVFQIDKGTTITDGKDKTDPTQADMGKLAVGQTVRVVYAALGKDKVKPGQDDKPVKPGQDDKPSKPDQGDVKPGQDDKPNQDGGQDTDQKDPKPDQKDPKPDQKDPKPDQKDPKPTQAGKETTWRAISIQILAE